MKGYLGNGGQRFAFAHPTTKIFAELNLLEFTVWHFSVMAGAKMKINDGGDPVYGAKTKFGMGGENWEMNCVKFAFLASIVAKIIQEIPSP